MDRLLQAAHAVSRWGAWFSGVLLILAAFVVGVDVLIRRFFNLSLGGADELSGFALAIGVGWSMGFTLLHRAHVRIDSAYILLPRTVRAALDILGLVAFIGFMGLVTWHGYGVFQQSFQVGARTMSRMATPLAVPQFLWVVGLTVFLLIASVLLVSAIMALVRGDWSAVQRQVGSRSVQDELREVEPAPEKGR